MKKLLLLAIILLLTGCEEEVKTEKEIKSNLATSIFEAGYGVTKVCDKDKM